MHTVEKNHSARFWQRRDQVCQKAKKVNKELKIYNINIS
ncbi:MAG: DUF45 domain-containing protein [Candidatus Vecturithrix sp.]|nr:DUF45 domain-containing protein [Candidatus Vecturithrix sp.]